MKICSLPDCAAGPVRGFGYCNKHWKRFHKYGDPLAGGPFIERGTDRRCELPDCEVVHYARGLCSMHYTRQRTGRDVSAPYRPHAPRGSRSICEVADCDRPVTARGLCAAHDARRRAGTEMNAPFERRLKTHEERFEHYTVRDEEKGCLLWTGATYGTGYGSMASGSRAEGGRPAHRIAYELATGETLKTYEAIHHICAVRNCVEPSHLQKVSAVENGVEMLERNWYIKRIAELESVLSEINPEHPLLNS